jgi:hypothetical protein
MHNGLSQISVVTRGTSQIFLTSRGMTKAQRHLAAVAQQVIRLEFKLVSQQQRHKKLATLLLAGFPRRIAGLK